VPSRNNDIGLRSARGPILLAVMVATGLVAIDATVIATAVPSIVDDIGGFSSFPWLFSIYLLASAVTVPVYAKLADTIGRKPVILFGISLFLIGSVLCGVAWDMPSLIVFRAVQGIGAGAILPITITIVGDIYSLEERARVQGYVASVWGISSVLGPTLGGFFAQFEIWRGIFLINIPLCLVAGFLLIRNFTERIERQRHRIDYLGATLLTVSMTLIILGVLEGGDAWAWNSPVSVAIFAVGALTLAAFVLVEHRAVEPVVALGLFRRPIVTTTTILGLSVGAGLIGLTAYVPTYLEGGLDVSPLVAGLALATLTIGWPIAATFSGRLYLRFGFRATAIFGAALVVVGTVILAAFSATPSILVVAIACFIVGVGFGFSAVPSLVAAQSSVEWNERGVVTGLNMFSRSLGQALGAAILGAVANGVIARLGGDATDPGTIISASSAVFVGAAIVAVLLVVSAIAMPRERKAASPAASPAAPATGSEVDAGAEPA
jgi:EmrB/QacA subfamily drug resistance transporter